MDFIFEYYNAEGDPEEAIEWESKVSEAEYDLLEKGIRKEKSLSQIARLEELMERLEDEIRQSDPSVSGPVVIDIAEVMRDEILWDEQEEDR